MMAATARPGVSLASRVKYRLAGWRQPPRGTADPLPIWRLLTGPFRVLPDFLIIGAQRSGTTVLYRSVRHHPSIDRSLRKEVHFFDLNYERGVSWYRAHFVSRLHRDYRAARRGQPLVTGEATPYYLLHPLAAQRAHAVVPAAKIIAILRNPVDRAFSHYQMQVRKRREPLSFEDAIAAEDGRVAGEQTRLEQTPTYHSAPHQRYSYLHRGRYAEQIEQWLKYFPRSSVHVIQAEEYYRYQRNVVQGVHQFLGLPEWEPIEFPKNNTQDYGRMDPATRERLVELFRPHNARLSTLLNREFSWDR